MGAKNTDMWSVRSTCRKLLTWPGTQSAAAKGCALQGPMWRQEIRHQDVLVMTFQILLNTLSAGFIQVPLHCDPVSMKS